MRSPDISVTPKSGFGSQLRVLFNLHVTQGFDLNDSMEKFHLFLTQPKYSLHHSFSVATTNFTYIKGGHWAGLSHILPILPNHNPDGCKVQGRKLQLRSGFPTPSLILLYSDGMWEGNQAFCHFQIVTGKNGTQLPLSGRFIERETDTKVNCPGAMQ